MRSRSIAVLSVAALSGLLLAGCASTPAAEPTTEAPALASSSVEAPAASGERVGADGMDLQVWSATAPDEAAVATLGEPADGNAWVTVTLAQWVSEEGLSDTDVAPVLRSGSDTDFQGEAVSPRRVEVPMTPDQSYTFAWSFEVPEDLVDPAGLAVCTTADADAACSQISG